MQQKSKKKKRKERSSLDTLYRKRDAALERVIAHWDKDQDVSNDALDALTLAHIAATFEFVGE